MDDDLQRFEDAQRGEFGEAVAELRAGRKRSHWIWFVFPQLRGLGSSPLAVHYGLAGVRETEAYLRDPLLRKRYHEVLTIVHEQLVTCRLRLDHLMGSQIDALKLVSSLTLFGHVAHTSETTEKGGAALELGEIARLADDVLAVAEEQGYRRCAFTMGEIAKSGKRD